MSHAVLVVSDDEAARGFMEQVLRRGGFNVNTAVDAAAAADRLGLCRYDAIVLDSNDAYAVLHYLESFDATLIGRTAVVTDRPRDAAKIELRDICRVLVKPFDARRLLDAVAECIAAA